MAGSGESELSSLLHVSSEAESCCEVGIDLGSLGNECSWGESKRFLLPELGSPCCSCCDSCSLSLLSNGTARRVWDSVEGVVDGFMLAIAANDLDASISPSNACRAAEHRGIAWEGSAANRGERRGFSVGPGVLGGNFQVEFNCIYISMCRDVARKREMDRNERVLEGDSMEIRMR